MDVLLRLDVKIAPIQLVTCTRLLGAQAVAVKARGVAWLCDAMLIFEQWLDALHVDQKRVNSVVFGTGSRVVHESGFAGSHLNAVKNLAPCPFTRLQHIESRLELYFFKCVHSHR